MKKFITYMALFISLPFFAQNFDYIGSYSDNGLAIVARNNKFGIIDLDKKQIQPLKYDDISFINEYYSTSPYYLTILNNKKGILNTMGKEIIPPVYSAIKLLEKNAFLVSKNDKVGLFSFTGKEIIPIKYDNITQLDTEKYLVYVKNNVGVFSSSGKEIIPIQYQGIYLSDDALLTYKDYKYGLYSAKGKEISPPLYDKIKTYRTTDYYYENDYYSTTLNNKKGIIDIRNTVIIPPNYEQIVILKQKYLTFLDGKTGLINSLGKETIPPKYDSITIIATDYYSRNNYDSLYYFQYKNNNHWGIIDRAGKEITPALYDKITPYYESYFKVKKNTKFGLIDSLGKEITPIKYQEITKDNNYFFAKLNDKLGILNAKGHEISLFTYDKIELISNTGYFEVTIGNKNGIFDPKTGQESIPVRYEKLGYSCDKSFLITELNGKYGVVDLTNKTVIPFDYQEIYEYWGLLAVKQNGKWGVMNFTGEMLIPFKYDELKRINNGSFIVSLANKYGIINAMGQTIIPLKYDKIESSYCSGNEISAVLDNKDGSINLRTKIFKETPQYKNSIHDAMGFEGRKNDAPPAPPALPIPSDPNKIFDGNIEQEAQYPGGIEALRSFVAAHIEYPKIALDNGTEGRVMIKFVVEKDGSVSNVSIVKDIGDGCGDEAVRVIKQAKKWKPALISGKPVRSVFRFPVAFRLPEPVIIENLEQEEQ